MVKPRESIVEGIQREAAAEATRESARRDVRATQRLRDTNAALRAEVERLRADVVAAETYRDALSYVRSNPLEPMTIPAREKSGRVHEATAVCILSDLHLEENVDPREIGGLNEYNPAIAAERMDRLAVGLVWHLELMRSAGAASRRAGYVIRELLLPNLGDVTTNYLRDEDMIGNAMAPMEGFVFAAQLESRFVRTILDRCPWLESIRQPRIPGNHDRMSMSRRTPFRNRVGLSSAPLLAHMIRSELRNEERFHLELSESEHVYIDVYGKLVRGIHGDRFKYQGGTGGIFVPARRHIMNLNKSKHAALTIFGHYHTHKKDDLWISNGSLIGPNAYSVALGMDPEPPAQVFFLIDKRRGPKMTTPIQVGGEDTWAA